MRRMVVWGGALLGVAASVVLLVALANVTVYGETSVPPRDDLPDLPAGLDIADETEGCGSGSCYREFDVVGDDGATPESILAQLPAEEECSAHSLVDWRPLCVGYRIRGDEVRGYVSLGKWLG